MASPSIVVADDEDPSRNALIRALRFFGYSSVKPAACGEELIAQATILISEGAKFLLIVDNQMPPKSGQPLQQWCGFETVAELCQTFPDAGVATKVLFLSRWGKSYLSQTHRALGEKLGLLSDEQWQTVYIPFVLLKDQLAQLLLR